MSNQNSLKYDVNVIAIDWSEGAAAPNYLSATENTKIVGKKIAQFIRNNEIDPKKIHCIGHSLGRIIFQKIRF